MPHLYHVGPPMRRLKGAPLRCRVTRRGLRPACGVVLLGEAFGPPAESCYSARPSARLRSRVTRRGLRPACGVVLLGDAFGPPAESCYSAMPSARPRNP